MGADEGGGEAGEADGSVAEFGIGDFGFGIWGEGGVGGEGGWDLTQRPEGEGAVQHLTLRHGDTE